MELTKEKASGVTVRLHTCSVCGTRDRWSKSWSWHGSVEEMDDDAPVLKFCSDKCRSVAAAEGEQ